MHQISYFAIQRKCVIVLECASLCTGRFTLSIIIFILDACLNVAISLGFRITSHLKITGTSTIYM